MPNPKTDDPDRKPLDPEMELVRRKMLRTLAISIGIMFIGLMAVAGAIVYKLSTGNEVAPAASGTAVPSAAPVKANAALPAGFSVQHVQLDGNRLLFYGRMADGSLHAFVFDLSLGRLTADITVGR